MYTAHARRGFTLVELLVVIAIIALLLSILMPALGKARDQAKLTICTANCKQIGAVTAVYQADQNGRVPAILHKWWQTAPSCHTLLSMALRDAAGMRRALPPGERPTDIMPYGTPAYIDYANNYLPKFFVCPSGRGQKKFGEQAAGRVTLTGPGGPSQTFNIVNVQGQDESYCTWANEASKHQNRPSLGLPTKTFPLADPEGFLKYARLPWHGLQIASNVDAIARKNKNLADPYSPVPGARWSSSDTKRLGSGGLSEGMVLYCDRGQTMLACGTEWIRNYKSHMKGNKGGTNALFADLHAEWVPGYQIGWP